MSDALKLTTYFGERSRAGGRLLAEELLDLHARHGLASSVLLRGIQGFGAKHRQRTDRLLTLSEDLPLVSIALDEPQRVAQLAAELGGIGREGLVTVERAEMYRDSHDLAALRASTGELVKATLYVGRHERLDGAPAFVTVCRELRAAGVDGATVLLGVDGTRHGERRRARFFAGNDSVPLMIVAIGEASRLVSVLVDLLDRLTDSLLTIERVTLCKRDGQLLRETADPLDGHAACKLTVVLSESALHEHRPAYAELLQRLRAVPSSGASSVRGIWGFHGEHEPHGDRLLALRRRVPVLTEIVEQPPRLAAVFAIVDELTAEHGLVTSETIPYTHRLDEPLDLEQI